jgi:thiamine monophosphate kinase
VRVWAEQLPVTPEALQVAIAMQQHVWQMALEGGDDYGLCFTVRPDAVDELIATVARETASTVTVIGEVLPAEKGRWLVLPDGQEMPLGKSWQHFQQAET